MFYEVQELERIQTAKVTFRVIQGHWQWCHSIGHVQFSIRVSLQLCSLSYTVNEISLISTTLALAVSDI